MILPFLCLVVLMPIQGLEAAVSRLLPTDQHGLRAKREYYHQLEPRTAATPESPVGGRALADYSKPFTLSYSKEDGPKFGRRNSKEEQKYYQPFYLKPTEAVMSRGNFFYASEDDFPYEYALPVEEKYKIVNPIYVEVGPKTYV
ncbi:uncharacterized protein [Periplaneta americana]|uniref:uncharacterized protein n=1 Tax=Periplaneta americana TaxID=6978 RepID=UPI0037E8C5D3